MIDLMIATSVMVAACLWVIWFVSRQIRQASPIWSVVLCFSVTAALGFVYFLNGWMTWARIVPVSAAIVWTNFTPLFLCIAAAAAWAIPGRPLWRRALLSSMLALFATGTLLQPILQPVIRPVPHSANTVWLAKEVCQQSSNVTCSPAAAATLLRANGINVEEHELIDWCLTDAMGTTSLGLWRGLKIATEETSYEPEVMDVSIDDLLSREPREDLFPCLILVGMPRFGGSISIEEAQRYTEQYGWPRGFRHCVVLYGPSSDGGVEIGDPSVGRERWSRSDLEVLWRGQAVRLARRQS